MKNRMKLNSMTMAGLFAAIYVVITIISLFFPLLDAFILTIMPIFAAYYAAKYRPREIILFNLATLLLCFICSVSDPFFSLLYIFPTILIGDVFGLLIKFKVKYYKTFFILSITYSTVLFLSIWLGTLLYTDYDLVDLVGNAEALKNYSLSLLYIIGLPFSIVCLMLISNELKKFKMGIEKETEIHIYTYIINIAMIILCIIMSFVNTNIYLLLFCLIITASIPAVLEFLYYLKLKQLILTVLFVVLSIGSLFIAIQGFSHYLPVFYISFLAILHIVKLCKKMYNLRNLDKIS